MQVGFRTVDHHGSTLGQLRMKLNRKERDTFSGDGPFYLEIEAGKMHMHKDVPVGVEPFVLSSAVEDKGDETIITFELDPKRVEVLRSRVPQLVPDNLRVLLNKSIGFDYRIRAMSADAEDGEHHFLLVAPPSVFDHLDQSDESPFDPVFEGGVWQDNGKTGYLDQHIGLHIDQPEPPFLVLRGKRIITRGVQMAVWELENEAAKDTFTVWSEDRNRRMIVESN